MKKVILCLVLFAVVVSGCTEFAKADARMAEQILRGGTYLQNGGNVYGYLHYGRFLVHGVARSVSGVWVINANIASDAEVNRMVYTARALGYSTSTWDALPSNLRSAAISQLLSAAPLIAVQMFTPLLMPIYPDLLQPVPGRKIEKAGAK